MIADINLEARTIAPYLRIVVPQGPKKSPSPMRQKLFKGVPKVFLGGASKLAVPSLGKEQEAPKMPEAKAQSPGQISGLKTLEAKPGQSPSQVSEPKIPEAQPGQISETQPGQSSGPNIPEAHPGCVASSEA